MKIILRYEDDFQLEPLELKYSDYITNNAFISVENFKKLFKSQGEDFETSAFEYENKTIENVINDLKISFNLCSLQEEEKSNSNFKTGKIKKYCNLSLFIWRISFGDKDFNGLSSWF